jgi:hypothetical protein
MQWKNKNRGKVMNQLADDALRMVDSVKSVKLTRVQADYQRVHEPVIRKENSWGTLQWWSTQYKFVIKQ